MHKKRWKKNTDYMYYFIILSNPMWVSVHTRLGVSTPLTVLAEGIVLRGSKFHGNEAYVAKLFKNCNQCPVAAKIYKTN